MSRRSSGEYSALDESPSGTDVNERNEASPPVEARLSGSAADEVENSPATANANSNGDEPKPMSASTKVTRKGGQANVAIQLNVTLSAVYIILIIIASIGTLLVWFESEYLDQHILTPGTSGSDGAEFFTAAIVIAMFALSVVPNYFVPPTHTASLKRFALFLLVNNIDSLVCRAHLFVEHKVHVNPFGNNDNVSDDETIIRTARAGAVLVLMALFPAFLLTFMYPSRPVKETAPKAASLKGLTSIFAALLLFIGQCLMWGLKDNCSLGAAVYVHNATPLMFSILLITSTIFDDKATQDVLFFFMVHFLVATVPVFEEGENSHNQSNFGSVWRAELAFLFLGALVYLFGMLLDRVKHHFARKMMESRELKSAEEENAEPTVKGRLKQVSSICQIVLLVLSLPAAIMIWSWSTHYADADSNSRMANYLAALGVLVPLFNVIGTLGAFDFFSFLGLLLSFNIAPLLGWMVTAGELTTGFKVGSYYRAGVILLLIIQILSPALCYVRIPKIRIDEYFKDAGKPSDSGRPSPIMMFLVWCLGAAYSWSEKTTVNLDTMFGNSLFPTVSIIAFLSFFSASHADVQRLLYLELSLLVTNPKIWPISEQGAPQFSTVFVLLNGLMFVTFYAWDHPDAVLEGLHYETEGVQVQMGVSVSSGQNTTTRVAADAEEAEKGLLSTPLVASSGQPSDGGTFSPEKHEKMVGTRRL